MKIDFLWPCTNRVRSSFSAFSIKRKRFRLISVDPRDFHATGATPAKMFPFVARSARGSDAAACPALVGAFLVAVERRKMPGDVFEFMAVRRGGLGRERR
jgi:hypothetical protein